METDMKVPPHSPEAERGVLGAILLDADAGDAMRVLDLCFTHGLTEDSFYEPRNRILFATMCEMARATMPIDSVSLHERLKTLGRLEAVGGIAAIQALVESTPTSAHAEYYIDIVRQRHLLRKIIANATEAVNACHDPERNANADILLGEMEQRFLEISTSHDSRTDWKKAVDTTLRAIETMFDRGGNMFDGLPTGFKYLDEKLLGLKPADMIVIAARPSVGKTSLAMNIAECVATGTDINGQPFKSGFEPTPVLIFSLEMDALSLSKRMLCGRAHVNSWKIARDQMAKEDKARASAALFKAADELKKAPILIDDASGLDISDIRARARRMAHALRADGGKGLGLIMIDYLQLCNCREYARQGRQLETARISGQIKAMAKELRIPVIVLSQLSRANEQRSDKNEVPKLSDLRDSGAIEQDADVVLLLRRPGMIHATRDDPKMQNQAIVDVAKHRNGETGEVKMLFIREWTRFGDRSQKDETAQAEEEEARMALAREIHEEPPPGYIQDELL